MFVTSVVTPEKKFSALDLLTLPRQVGVLEESGIGYYEANELTPPADGIEILSELDEVELDAVELDFLRNALGPEQPERMLKVLAQLGLADEDE